MVSREILSMHKFYPKKAQAVRTSHEQQAESEALFTSIGEGAISTDEYGNITRVNPSAQRLLGFSEDELIGSWFPSKIVAVTFDDQVINLIDRPISKAFLTGKPISKKMYYRTKNGKKLPVAINISPILLDEKPLGAIQVFRDISLEHEVDRMKSEFISLASHQLRTPLSAIKTYTHMLFDGYMGELNNSQKKSLNTIIHATDRMNELISTLLNVTRIESGTIAITRKPVDLHNVSNEVINELQLGAKSKSIDLKLISVHSPELKVKTDLLIFKEILSNLVINAIKYTPDGGRVRIKIRPRLTDILFEVKDNGWGIPKYSQDQVFSKFFRAANIVKRETTGTGLGLYLVKGLVDAIGGQIWFKSEEGKGSSFYFTVPSSPTSVSKPLQAAKRQVK